MQYIPVKIPQHFLSSLSNLCYPSVFCTTLQYTPLTYASQTSTAPVGILFSNLSIAP